ncbi:MAG: hypothetical protein F6J97_11660, partial [Leptolyngbya sp. SIO4C1]|nr:hypothetical protein [Leptolyngbya sp. SIO4C1]
MLIASSAPKIDRQQSYLTLFEQGFSVMSLLFFAGAAEPLLGGNLSLLTLARYSILMLSGLLALMRWRSTLRTVHHGALIWPLIGLAILSVLWSRSPVDAMDSIKGEILQTTTFALYFASRFRPREQLRLLAIALGIAALLSLFYVFAIPSVGKHLSGKFAGAWRGIYNQKNTFSAYMTLTLITFFVLSSHNERRLERRLSQGFLALSITMIILSTSMTGLI